MVVLSFGEWQAGALQKQFMNITGAKIVATNS